MYQNPKYDLKFHYRRALELSVIASLSIVILVMMIYKKFETDVNVRAVEVVPIKLEHIPITKATKPEIIPEKPVIPVESIEIDPAAKMEISFADPEVIFEITAPPEAPPSDELRVSYYAVEIKPTLIGGESAIVDYIMKHSLFPEVAAELGVSGSTQIGFTINTEGIPEDVHIMGEKPEGLGFGIAGMEVMRAMRFTPGIQQDKPVRVDMQQTIKFTAQSR